MIRKFWRLVALIPVLTMLWGFANTIGITSAFNTALGSHIPTFHLPVVDKYIDGDLGGAADEAKNEAKNALDKIRAKKAGSASTSGLPFENQRAYRIALTRLSALTVAPAGSMSGYSRAQFGPAWTDDNNGQWGHNGCDTRDDILKRDLTQITYRADTAECVVATGVFHDPYTATTIDFVRGPDSAVIQIDHTVALGDAWTTGAATWTAAHRQDYANDPLVLLASQGKANEAKGDDDASTWLPPNRPYDAAYVARQIAVKTKYHLWVTPAEHDAMERTLQAAQS